MNKQFDLFQKMKIKEVCENISRICVYSCSKQRLWSAKDKYLGNTPKTLIKSRNNMFHVVFIEIENTSSN